MENSPAIAPYRFGIFELDPVAGELRRAGIRVKLHSQPFQILVMFLERPGELLTREQICQRLWPDGTFVDFDHGLNSAMNRLRDALGDKAGNPRFIETLARRGYRFLAPVERAKIERADAERANAEPTEVPPSEPEPDFTESLLATERDLPPAPRSVVQTLFVLLQAMYLSFYAGALANLPEIDDLLSSLPFSRIVFSVLIVTAAVLIPVRTFLLCATLFKAPGMKQKFARLWWLLLPMDAVWSLAPFLLLRHVNLGVALGCTSLLVYSPFAQRSLVLMGAGSVVPRTPLR